MEGALAWAQPLARFVHDAALTLLFGGLLFPAYARPSAGVGERLRPWLVAEAATALVSAAAVFALTVGGMAGSLASAVDPGLLGSTATGSEVGWLFLARAALIAACCAALALGRGRRLATACAGAALAGLALTGHAREGAGWPMLAHVVADALHLLCAGLWIGALPWFAVMLAPGAEPALAAVRRFSRVAAVAVAVLLLTGVAATLLLVGSPLALPTTLWGRLLMLKAALALVMVGLATHNRFRATPGLAAADGAAAATLRRNARWELALAFAVLGLVGWIGALPFEPGS